MAGCARGSMRVGNFDGATRGRRQAVQNKALAALSCPQGWQITFSLLLGMAGRIAAKGGRGLTQKGELRLGPRSRRDSCDE
jgi:hypothetical protein